MKAVVFALLLMSALLGHAAFAHEEVLVKSPVMLAAAESIKAFAEDFRKTQGRELNDEFVGVYAGHIGGGAQAGIYSMMAQSTLTMIPYGCQFLGDQAGRFSGVHCQQNGNAVAQAYQPAARFFKYRDFITAFGEAVQLFSGEGRDPGSISQVKAWQNRTGIELILSHGPNAELAYMMCHYHGHHIDCHSQKKPGAGQPQ